MINMYCYYNRECAKIATYSDKEGKNHLAVYIC